MDSLLIGVIVLVIFIVVVLMKTAVVVPQRNEYVIERLGKYRTTLEAGFHILIPFLDRIAYKRSLKEEPIDIPAQTCITVIELFQSRFLRGYRSLTGTAKNNQQQKSGAHQKIPQNPRSPEQLGDVGNGRGLAALCRFAPGPAALLLFSRSFALNQRFFARLSAPQQANRRIPVFSYKKSQLLKLIRTHFQL